MTGLDTGPRGLLGQAAARVSGTCGELAQGVVDGEHFHITCPIDLYSTASVSLYAGTGRVYGPEDCPKACRGAELTLAYLNRPDRDVRLSVTSPLPRGKGMASSTADVAAAIGATALAAGASLSSAEVAQIALQVEPSDGSMFPGIAMFDHRQGRVFKALGPAPAMRLLVLDFGGVVDTLSFNAVDWRPTLARLEACWREALALIEEGVHTADVSLIGRGATLSALAHQRVLPKPQLAAVVEFARQIGGIGVNVAHSGTVLGVLFPDDARLLAKAAVLAWERLSGLEALYQQRLIGGGVVPVRAE